MALGGVCHEYLKKDTIMRDVYSPSQGGAVSNVIKIEQGGHGKNTAKDAREALQVYGTEDIGAPNGLIPLKNGVIPTGLLNPALVSSDGLYGPTTVGVDSKVLYKINNFDSFKDYSLKAQRGHVVLTEEGVVYNSPSIVGTDVISFGGKDYQIQISISSPSIQILNYVVSKSETSEEHTFGFTVVLNSILETGDLSFIYKFKDQSGNILYETTGEFSGSPEVTVPSKYISPEGSNCDIYIRQGDSLVAVDSIFITREEGQGQVWIQRYEYQASAAHFLRSVGSITFSEDGNVLVFSSFPYTCGTTLYKTDREICIYRFSESAKCYVRVTSLTKDSRNGYYGTFALHPNGEYLIVGDSDSRPTGISDGVTGYNPNPQKADIYRINENDVTLLSSTTSWTTGVVVHPMASYIWLGDNGNFCIASGEESIGGVKYDPPLRFYSGGFTGTPVLKSTVELASVLGGTYGVRRNLFYRTGYVNDDTSKVADFVSDSGKNSWFYDKVLKRLYINGDRFSGHYMATVRDTQAIQFACVCLDVNDDGTATLFRSFTEKGSAAAFAFTEGISVRSDGLFVIGNAIIGGQWNNAGFGGTRNIISQLLSLYRWDAELKLVKRYDLPTISGGVIRNSSWTKVLKYQEDTGKFYFIAYDYLNFSLKICSFKLVGDTIDGFEILKTIDNSSGNRNPDIPNPILYPYNVSVDINTAKRIMAVAGLSEKSMDIFKY